MTHTTAHTSTPAPPAPPPMAPPRPAMDSVGDRLRDARTARGMSLDTVARATRIPRSQLEHLEHGRFADLPGETYVRGFLRSYADAVGVDSDSALVQYASERRSVGTTIRPAERQTAKKARRVGLVVACSVFLLLLAVATLAVSRPRPNTGPGELSMSSDSDVAERA